MHKFRTFPVKIIILSGAREVGPPAKTILMRQGQPSKKL